MNRRREKEICEEKRKKERKGKKKKRKKKCNIEAGQTHLSWLSIVSVLSARVKNMSTFICCHFQH
jgi:hypothetical protein